MRIRIVVLFGVIVQRRVLNNIADFINNSVSEVERCSVTFVTNSDVGPVLDEKHHTLVVTSPNSVMQCSFSFVIRDIDDIDQNFIEKIKRGLALGDIGRKVLDVKAQKKS